MNVVDQFTAWFGQLVITVSIAVPVVGWLFKTYSTKWLDKHFSEKLQSLKHQQQKELEDFKFDLNRLMDRTVKLHQYEFDELPILWAKCVKAFGSARYVTTGLQRYAEISKMEDEELRGFLEESGDFTENDIEKIINSTDRDKDYRAGVDWHQLHKAQTDFHEFNEKRLVTGIFLTDDLQEKFQNMTELINLALIEKGMANEYNDYPNRFKNAKKLEAEGTLLIKNMEKLIKERLWNEAVHD